MMDEVVNRFKNTSAGYVAAGLVVLVGILEFIDIVLFGVMDDENSENKALLVIKMVIGVFLVFMGLAAIQAMRIRDSVPPEMETTNPNHSAVTMA